MTVLLRDHTDPVAAALQQVERAALRSVAAQHYQGDDEPLPFAAMERQEERLILAARDLVRAVEALPESKRPIGWDAEVAA
jgi:hypothetical protein